MALIVTRLEDEIHVGPEGFAGIRFGVEIAGEYMAEDVEDEVVILHAASVVVEDDVEGFYVGDGKDDEAGLFEDLADAGFAGGLAELDGTAGERPGAGEGFAAAAHKQDLGAAMGSAEDDGPDAGDGSVGVGSTGLRGEGVHAGLLELQILSVLFAEDGVGEIEAATVELVLAFEVADG